MLLVSGELWSEGVELFGSSVFSRAPRDGTGGASSSGKHLNSPALRLAPEALGCLTGTRGGGEASSLDGCLTIGTWRCLGAGCGPVDTDGGGIDPLTGGFGKENSSLGVWFLCGTGGGDSNDDDMGRGGNPRDFVVGAWCRFSCDELLSGLRGFFGRACGATGGGTAGLGCWSAAGEIGLRTRCGEPSLIL